MLGDLPLSVQPDPLAGPAESLEVCSSFAVTLLWFSRTRLRNAVEPAESGRLGIIHLMARFALTGYHRACDDLDHLPRDGCEDPRV